MGHHGYTPCLVYPCTASVEASRNGIPHGKDGTCPFLDQESYGRPLRSMHDLLSRWMCAHQEPRWATKFWGQPAGVAE